MSAATPIISRAGRRPTPPGPGLQHHRTRTTATSIGRLHARAQVWPLMPFYQQDDRYHSDPRVLRVGMAAFGLYCFCGNWIAGNTWDGVVPEHYARIHGTTEWISKLVSAGLWQETDGGYIDVDYHARHHNQTPAQVQAYRKRNAERQAAWREREKSRRESRVSNARSNGVTNALVTGTPSPPKGGGGGAPRNGGGTPPTTPHRYCTTHRSTLLPCGLCALTDQG